MIRQFNIPRLDGPGRWIGLVGAAVVVLCAVFLGAVLFVVLLGAVAVLSAVVGARLWWRRRKLGSSSAPPSSETSGRVIDAEYSVVDDRDS
jgi:hypothetical protein